MYCAAWPRVNLLASGRARRTIAILACWRSASILSWLSRRHHRRHSTVLASARTVLLYSTGEDDVSYPLSGRGRWSGGPADGVFPAARRPRVLGIGGRRQGRRVLRGAAEAPPDDIDEPQVQSVPRGGLQPPPRLELPAERRSEPEVRGLLRG